MENKKAPLRELMRIGVVGSAYEVVKGYVEVVG